MKEFNETAGETAHPTIGMKEDFRRMVKWAIRTMFEKHPDGEISLGELREQLSIAWKEYYEEGGEQ